MILRWLQTGVAGGIAAVGLFFIFYPREVQRGMKNRAESWPAGWRTFRSYVQSPGYPIQLRAIGALLVFMAALVLYSSWLPR